MPKITSNKIIRFDIIDSTQKYALELLKQQEDVDGTVIIATQQTNGVGRLNRKWSSPIDGVWMSIILQRKLPLEYFQGFSVRYGLRVTQLLQENIGLAFKIKWPNDLYLNDKKCGGILIDTSSQNEMLTALVVGIGVNVNVNVDLLPDELLESATSILHESGKNHSLGTIEEILIRAFKEIISEITNEKLADITEIWKDYSYTFNTKIKVKIANKILTGLEIGIGSYGDLKLKIGEIIETISTGEIELLRKADDITQH
ncbi:MAG: biotin--[acetyl-CoA-carboxylase] ligase [Candidatus Heimdallarchaeota archaeon]